VEAELLHADRRTDGLTDMTNLAVVFDCSANARKKAYVFLACYDLVCRKYDDQFRYKINVTAYRDLPGKML
jgi:hypothetical protein